MECGGMDLDGLGCTIAIREAFMEAKGDVLFRNFFERVRFMDNFGNGRYVHNLIERAVQNQAIRLLAATGLSSVKAIIRKVIASFKLKKVCMDKGICNERPSLHMVFTGNPGTAKTTVERLFAEIMKDEKVLSSGNFVEAGRADLVGDHVGATALLVKKKFKEAQGGVLFIDEAYSLCDGYENGFGDEAINTLVQEMENHRDHNHY